MRGKTAIMILAGATLLGLLIVLKQAIGRSDDEPRVVVATDESASEDDEQAPASGASGTGRRDARIPAAVGGAGRSPTPPADERTGDAPSLGGGGGVAPDVEKPVKRPPIATKAQLREQNIAVEPLVAQCVAGASGNKDGSATLTFIVAPKGTTAVIESTDVDRDATTVDNESLLECMHKTAERMQFGYVPDADAVVARRKVTIENGQVTENRLVEFSYLRK